MEEDDKSKKILILTTGGTIFQKLSKKRNRMERSVDIQNLLQQIDSIGLEFEFQKVSERSGADLSMETIFQIRDIVQEKLSKDKITQFLLLTGTDALEEMAFALDLLLPSKEYCYSFIITGSMKPSDILGYDGIANIQQALLVANHSFATHLGVLVVINDSIHAARYVRKSDSQLIGSFQSHPGPIGQIRAGKPFFYYSSLPAMEKYLVDFSYLKTKVMIYYTCVAPFFPEAMIQELDGLVIAGMGTGSLNEELIHMLSKYTSLIPIVITSRCEIGQNYDDYYYRGSLEKYTSKGFHILGYENLNPLQARLKLIFEISSTSK